MTAQAVIFSITSPANMATGKVSKKIAESRPIHSSERSKKIKQADA